MVMHYQQNGSSGFHNDLRKHNKLLGVTVIQLLFQLQKEKKNIGFLNNLELRIVNPDLQDTSVSTTINMHAYQQQ